MPKTYYDSELTGEQIESALEAIDGVVTPSNNGKILRVKDGSIEAVSASEYTSGIEVEPLSVTANDTYTAPAGKAYSPVTVNVSGSGGGGNLPSGGTDGDVLVKNGATDYDATWKKTPPQMGSLATIEPTSTVTQKTQYVKGEYLVYNGQLYKVTASTITQGQTLTPGGNIEVATVGDKLTGISHLHWGGNCMGLARTDGRINITLPYQGEYTRVEVNTTQLTAQGTSIYGSKGSTGCTFEMQNLVLGNIKAIYFNLQPSVTLSSYTDLGKQVMIYVSQEIVFTLS